MEFYREARSVIVSPSESSIRGEAETKRQQVACLLPLFSKCPAEEATEWQLVATSEIPILNHPVSPSGLGKKYPLYALQK